MKVIKQVRLNDNINKQLEEIVEKRKRENNLNATKQGIVAEYVMLGHKKECKK